MYMIKLKKFLAFMNTILKISSLCINRGRKEMGFVDFSNPNTNIYAKTFTNHNLITNVVLRRNRIFNLPKCRKCT